MCPAMPAILSLLTSLLCRDASLCSAIHIIGPMTGCKGNFPSCLFPGETVMKIGALSQAAVVSHIDLCISVGLVAN